MDVRCPQCETLYELDDEQVANRPVTLKCSQCQHLFRLEGRVAVSQENQRRWMIRRKESGDVLYLNSFDVLHEWIMKQEVHTEDEISRTGDKWMELGEIGEFTPLFQVVESITQLGADLEDRSDVSSIATRMKTDTPAPQPNAATPAPAPAPEAPSRERVRTSIQYGGAKAPADRSGPMRTEDITQKVGPSGPEPELPPSPGEAEPGPEGESTPTAEASASGDRSQEFEIDMAREADQPAAAEASSTSSSSPGGLLVFVGLILLAAAGGYAWFTQDTSQATDEDVVPIVDKEKEGPASVSPRETVDTAVGNALAAAERKNDAIWTMWFETASEPFYVALDTAYAAADEASIGHELEDKVADARTMLENGRLKQATQLFQQVLAKQPENAAAITGMGWTLLELGRVEEAAQHFEKSTKLDPQYGDAYIGLGSAQRRLGDPKAAYDAYDLYLGRFPRGAKASIARYQMNQLKKQLGM